MSVRRLIHGLTAAMLLGGMVSFAVTAQAGGPATLNGNPMPTIPGSLPLQHMWRADGDTRDAQGTATGTWSGTPSYIGGHMGYAGDEGFSFDGTNDVSIEDAGVGSIGTADFSLDMWVKVSPQSANYEVFSIGCTSNATAGIDLRYDAIGFSLDVEGTSGGTGFGDFAGSVVDGGWHEVTVSRSGTDISLAVDGGTPTTQQSAIVLDITTSDPVELGNSACATANSAVPLVGALDDVSLSSPALTPTLHGKPLPPIPGSLPLQNLWRADGDATDSFGAADATWSGTPAYTTGHMGYAGDQAYALDGSNTLSVTDPDVGNFRTGDFSINFWIQVPNGSGNYDILSKGDWSVGGPGLDLWLTSGNFHWNVVATGDGRASAPDSRRRLRTANGTRSP